MSVSWIPLTTVNSGSCLQVLMAKSPLQLWRENIFLKNFSKKSIRMAELVDIKSLKSSTKRADLMPAGFVFHTGRCGSTLISNYLRTSPHVVVINESPVLSSFLMYTNNMPFKKRSRYFKNLINFHISSTKTEKKIIFKFTSIDLLHFDFILACYPTTPKVCLFRDPVSIISSQVLRPPGWAQILDEVSPKKYSKPKSLSEFISMQMDLLTCEYKTILKYRNKFNCILSYNSLMQFGLIQVSNGIGLKGPQYQFSNEVLKFYSKSEKNKKFFKEDERKSTPQLVLQNRPTYPHLIKAYERLEKNQKSGAIKYGNLHLNDTIIFLNSDTHVWQSMIELEKEFSRIYSCAYGDNLAILNYSYHFSNDEICSLIEQLKKRFVSRFVFPSYRAPAFLLDLLCKTFPDAKFVFHIYGNFVPKIEYWKQFKGKAQLIVLSQRQKNLVASIVGSKVPIHVCAPPMRLNVNIYPRSSFRQSLGINKKAHIFMYAGRLSSSKNIHSIIRSFVNFQRHCPSNAYLILCGMLDDSANIFPRQLSKYGSYYLALNKLINDIEPKIFQKIKCLGPLSESETEQLMVESNTFVSLSTFDGEDFGLGPAKALALGCRAILTNWGGYSDFKKNYNPQVTLIPVEKQERFVPREDICARAFEKHVRNKVKKNQFEKKPYLIESCINRLSHIFQEPQKYFKFQIGSAFKLDRHSYFKLMSAYASSHAKTKLAHSNINDGAKYDSTLLPNVRRLNVESKTVAQYWPWSKQIVAPVPLYFFDQIDLKALPSNSNIFLRDGKESLRKIFLKTDPNLIGNHKLFFHRSALEAISKSISHNFRSFDIVETHTPKNPSKLIILGEYKINPDKIKLIRTLVKERKLKISEVYYLDLSANQSTKNQRVLETYFNIPIKLVSWSQLLAMLNLKEFYYAQLLSEDICADNYVNNLCMSRGAINFFPKERRLMLFSDEISLSPYHSLFIYNNTKQTDEEVLQASKASRRQNLKIF